MDSKIIKQTQTSIDSIEKLFDEIKELSQNRSNFTLEKFVIGQHDLPARQRKQVLDELLSLLEGFNQCISAYENAEIDIDELQNAYAETKYQVRRNDIKLREKQREIKFIELRLIGLLRECDFLLKLLNKMPRYTREQFEQEEAEYWERRLTRQARLMDMWGSNYGNVDAILQMYSTPGMPKFPMPLKSKDYLKAAIGDEDKKLEDKK